ncbi:MAG: hypothetical protein CSYNP_04462 [Syntrophus sp. SKADARSKE-3]|nr:hypothetical protein [Syntrophus sp. SKADARSKE-3]
MRPNTAGPSGVRLEQRDIKFTIIDNALALTPDANMDWD